VLVVAALVGGGVVGLQSLAPGADRVRVVGPADQPGASGTGLDWLLTREQYLRYTSAHPEPSPGYEKVPSPAPVDDALRALTADVKGALGAVALMRQDAADGGAKGRTVIDVRTTSGDPLVVERVQLTYPEAAAGYTGPGTPDAGMADMHYTDPALWSDGTAYTVVTGTSEGYGLPESEGGQSWTGPWVIFVTPDGLRTRVTAPVDTATLLTWARAIDAQRTNG
jgi:hypothetical protein